MEAFLWQLQVEKPFKHFTTLHFEICNLQFAICNFVAGCSSFRVLLSSLCSGLWAEFVAEGYVMFDPYHKWLGIPKDQRPPTFYQLLGITPGEEDVEVIEEAAIRQTTHVRAYQIGPHAKECTQLLNEIAQARSTLTNPAKRKQYDATLGQKAKEKLAGMPGPANQVTSNPPVPKAQEIFADLEATELLPVGKKPLAKIGPSGSKKGLIYLAAGGGVVAVLAIVLIVVLSGKKPDNQQVQNPDKGKLKDKQNQKKNQDKNNKKDPIVRINKEKVDNDKKDGVVKQEDKELAAKFIGRCKMTFHEEGGNYQGERKWQFTEDRAIEDGRDRGTWHVEGGKVIVTYSQKSLGQAVLEFKDDDTLLGKHRQRNNQIFNWVLVREGAAKAKPLDPIVIGPDASKFFGKYQIVQFEGPNPTVEYLFLTKYREVWASGQTRGDWKTEGNKLVLTLTLNNHKGAVFQANEDGLIGQVVTRDGNKVRWELKRQRVLPPLENLPGKVSYVADSKESRVNAKRFRKDGMMSEGAKEYPIEVDGVRYPHSIFLHPHSQEESGALFPLKQEYDYFLADTLVPQGIIPGQLNPYSPLVFEVLGLEKSTWKSLWKSPARDRCGISDRVKVSVKGIRSLELRINCPNQNNFCWGVWIEPRLVSLGNPKERCREGKLFDAAGKEIHIIVEGPSSGGAPRGPPPRSEVLKFERLLKEKTLILIVMGFAK
jgi:hypothetical protein